MKKILLMLFAVILFCVSYSQTAFRQTTANPTGAVTNTSVDTMAITLSNSYTVVSIQPVITKVSGTVAGTAILQVSINGTNYVTTDTLTNTNVATNTVVWNKASAAKYWRILVTGSGTMAATASARISAK